MHITKKILCLLAGVFTITLFFQTKAFAEDADTYMNGVFIETMNISGQTKEEAKAGVEEYIEELKQVPITLCIGEEHKVETTIGDLGFYWTNQDVLEEALSYGKTGNIISRYKMKKDLLQESKVFDVLFDFDKEAIRKILTEECSKFNQKAIDYDLKRKNGQFQVVKGQTGYQVMIDSSEEKIYAFLKEEWMDQPSSIQVNTEVTLPKGSEEELAMVQDVLGTFTTSFETSAPPRAANVNTGCRLINGTLLYPGEEFSMYDAVSPYTAANGYYPAGSFVNGRVVDSMGGGICQVSTTLYNAALLAELEITERHNHSMIVEYVNPAADAAIAESAGKDFRFVNTTEYPVYIEGISRNQILTFNIYGKETRAANRTVQYFSEILEETNPVGESVIADATKPVGYVEIQDAYIGYKAKLWKIVKVNGVTSSRTLVNSSSYRVSPRTAVVGVATTDPVWQNEMMAAIGTSDIEHVRKVIAILTNTEYVEYTGNTGGFMGP